LPFFLTQSFFSVQFFPVPFFLVQFFPITTLRTTWWILYFFLFSYRHWGKRNYRWSSLWYCSGYDEIPMWLVKGSSKLISSPLKHVINISINSGIVPDQTKIARILLLFKSGDNRVIDQL
jgi:hypothetical protein